MAGRKRRLEWTMDDPDLERQDPADAVSAETLKMENAPKILKNNQIGKSMHVSL